MPVNNFIKDIISKDTNISKNAIEKLIKSNNISQFEDLCKRSDFIFSFIRERIINDFVKLINKEDLSATFNFAKIYSPCFEDIAVKSWLKFANNDLTDEILELFEIGTDEQKAHAAKYFSVVKDPLALEFLKKEAKSDFEPLRINCAKTLAAFGDEEILEEFKNIILNSDDDFKKLSAYEFLCAYNSFDSVKFCVSNCFKSPFSANIISYLMDFSGFETIKNTLTQDEILRVYSALIEAYPEDIALDTVLYYQILDFSKFVYNFKNQISNNVLYLAKIKFEEFQSDLYSFDLDKNVKNELKEISKFLNSLNFDFSNLNDELTQFKNAPWRYFMALDTVINLKKTEFAPYLADLINSQKLELESSAKTAQTLFELGKADLIERGVVEKIENINVRALIESYLK